MKFILTVLLTAICSFVAIAQHAGTSIESQASIISFDGKVNHNKVILNWVTADNESTGMFEIEKSENGSDFEMIALVFGSEKKESDNYMFFEKVGKQKVFYRIKIIDRNKRVSYSSVVTIAPGTATTN
jgi:hypothetical protein